MIKYLHLILVMVTLVGCSGGSETDSVSDLPDHIRNLENLTAYPADTEPTHTINLVEEQIFGDTDTLFFRQMSNFAIDDADRVYISDNKIHVFQPEGSYLGSVGRDGAGPGEFRSVSRLQAVSDHLYLYDSQLQRVSSYAIPSFEFESTFVPQENGIVEISDLEGTRIYDMFVTSEGNYLFGFNGLDDPDYMTSGGNNFTDTFVYKNHFLLLDHSGQILSDILFNLPGYSILFNREPNSMSMYYLSYHGNSLIDIGPDDRIYTAWTQEFLIKSMDSDGNYQSAIYYPVPKQEFLVDAFLDSTYSNSQTRNMMRETVDFPDAWPLLDSMLIDDENRIWISTVEQGSETHEWWVLMNDGKLISKFEWPEDHFIVEVKNGFLYSNETDEETGLESLVKYRIVLTEN